MAKSSVTEKNHLKRCFQGNQNTPDWSIPSQPDNMVCAFLIIYDGILYCVRCWV